MALDGKDTSFTSHFSCSRHSHLRRCDPRADGWLFRLALPVAVPFPGLGHELHRVREGGKDLESLEGTGQTTLLRRRGAPDHLSNLRRRPGFDPESRLARPGITPRYH